MSLFSSLSTNGEQIGDLISLDTLVGSEYFNFSAAKMNAI